MEEAQAISAISQKINTYIILSIGQINLMKNKKQDAIQKAKGEVITKIKNGNLLLANYECKNILVNEAYINVYDIVVTFLRNINNQKGRISESRKIPETCKSEIDSVIYVSNKIDIEYLLSLIGIFEQLYGSSYISNVQQNTQRGSKIEQTLIDILNQGPPSDELITKRLKRICIEKNIKFPGETFSDNNNFVQNPFENDPGNNYPFTYNINNNSSYNDSSDKIVKSPDNNTNKNNSLNNGNDSFFDSCGCFLF